MGDFVNVKKDKKKNKRIVLYYSCLFLLLSILLIIYLIINGRTNINRASDGMSQHYRAMLYYSSYIRQVFKNLLSNQQFIAPHWNHSIGEGADIISVLHSDAVGDPLTFLSFLIPQKYIPLYYLFNTFVRVYLGGLFFIKLCLYFGKENTYGIIAGSIVYDFCFWSLSSITHHIYFLTPLMYMPLLILGVEKIINDDEPYTFVIAVTLSCVSWLYFFYMQAACTAIYGLVRVFNKYHLDFKAIIKKLFVIMIYVMFGLGMACAVLCPVIYNYLNDSRMGIENALSMFYPPFFYERLLTIFVSNDSTYDLFMGFAAPTMLTLMLSIKNNRKNQSLCIINLITFVCVCLPICGKILNGFAFVSQRWSFAIALPIAYSMTNQWDEIKNNKKYLFVVFAFMLGWTVYSAWSRNERVIIPMCFTMFFLLTGTSDIYKRIRGFDLRQMLMIILIVFNIIYIEQYNLSSRGGDVLDDLVTIENAKNIPYSSEAYVMRNYLNDKNDGFYRYTSDRLTNNSAMTQNVNSTSSYWSITNPSDQMFRLKLGLLDYISWQIHGYDNRAELESLASVKYYIVSDTYDGVLPYGFELEKTIDGYNIYTNKYVLPFGYTYTNVMSYEVWDSLNPVERQKAMMYSVVSDNYHTANSQEYDIESLRYNMVCSDGISVNNNTIKVEKENAYITLTFNGVEKKENYLIIEGLNYEDIYDVIEDDHTFSSIVTKASNGKNITLSHMSKSHHYYFGKSDYVAYYGYGEPLNEIRISFSLVGLYTFDKISIIVEGIKDYENCINALSEEHLTDVVFGNDYISGSISTSKDKYLLLSVPYSSGWKAYVDGKEEQIFRANEHYIGIALSKGIHKIELRYNTPGLKLGSMISFISIVCFIILIMHKRKYSKNNKK